MNKAVFLDRDGTIIKDKGYISKNTDVEFYKGVFESLKALQDRFMLFIVTNQSGISKGILKVEEVVKLNSYIVSELGNNGIKIHETYCCPHDTSDFCACRKPKTHFIEIAAKAYALDVKSSYVIGDHPSDVQLAINAKANGIYVLTGHGRKHIKDMNDDTKSKIQIFKNINFASKNIMHK